MDPDSLSGSGSETLGLTVPVLLLTQDGYCVSCTAYSVLIVAGRSYQSGFAKQFEIPSIFDIGLSSETLQKLTG